MAPLAASASPGSSLICSDRVQDGPTGGHPMKIVAVDPQARVLSEDEVLALLREPILMRLGMVDGKGWPVVTPVWHVFESGVFRVAVGKTSHKDRKSTRLNSSHLGISYA